MNENISDRLLFFIRKNKLKQAQVAKRIGVVQHTISDFCNGKRELKKHYVLALEAAYGLNPSWLLHGREQMFLTRGNHGNGMTALATRYAELPPQEPAISKSDEILHEVRDVSNNVQGLRTGQRDLAGGMKKLHSTSRDLETKINHIATDVEDLCSGQRNLETRIGTLDVRLTHTENKTKEASKRLNALEKRSD